MRLDNNAEELEYTEETAQVKYKKMFKVDEVDANQELDVTHIDDKPFEIGQDPYSKPTVQEKINLQTTVTGMFNGNKFLQLRIPKRYETTKDEYKTLFEANKKNNDNVDDIKDEILKKENEIFLNWRRSLNSIETEMMQKFKEELAGKKDFLK